MKFLKHPFLFLLSSTLVISCASYKSKLQTAAITFPELGSVVKKKGKLWYASSEQVGVLNFENPLLATAQVVPFDKSTFKKYAHAIESANRTTSIVYTDSMPNKPKYVRLQLLDKIGLTTLLNSADNTALRSYLENDPDYKLVTAITLTVADELQKRILEAEHILVQQDGAGKLSIVLKNKQQTNELEGSHTEVFDYSYVSFCWGEDRYHTKIIKALVQDNKGCPNATYTKAAKVKSHSPSYLKL
tara:strand:- start:5356 stop:6090 length:735 start_codon:yes stop_codon:yes gene_type:complete